MIDHEIIRPAVAGEPNAHAAALPADFQHYLRSWYGPVGAMLLDRGRLFPWRRPSAGMRPQPLRACWHNAYKLHQAMGWGYAFGLAQTDEDPPAQHAWAVDHEGNAVDLTWWGSSKLAATRSRKVAVNFMKHTRRVYFGVVLSPEEMIQCLPDTDAMTPLGAPYPESGVSLVQTAAPDPPHGALGGLLRSSLGVIRS